MLRAAKNDNGVIIAIGNDEGQSGNYPIGSSNEARLGVWCGWTFESIPAFDPVVGLDPSILAPMRFKENGTADGIALRSDAEVIASPSA